MEAVRWAAGHRAELAGNGRCPLLVAGDSSGGNLATLTCLRLRDQGGSLPAAQVLIYSNTDLTLSQPSARTWRPAGALPPTTEGEAYAARLEAAGTPVLLGPERAMIHGFLTLDTRSPAAAAAGDWYPHP